MLFHLGVSHSSQILPRGYRTIIKKFVIVILFCYWRLMLNHSFGYTTAISQLLTVPPYVVASEFLCEFIDP